MPRHRRRSSSGSSRLCGANPIVASRLRSQVQVAESAASCVLGLADVVGGHVALAASGLAQPPLAVAVLVLELQDAQPLVGRDAQLVGTAGVEGVQGVVDLRANGQITQLVSQIGIISLHSSVTLHTVVL